MNPTISIIVPIYNQGKYLGRCLDSILAQTFTDFEVLCVNDHSTDSTADILKKYTEKNSRIVVLEDPGKGVSDARNFGIENAKGEYIGFVDSDDFIQPQMYEFMLRAIKENQCDMVVCGYKKTDVIEREMFEYNCRETKVSEYSGGLFDWGKDELIMSGSTTKLLKKELVNRCPEYEKFRIGEDTVFCAELWKNANRVFLVDLPLYIYFNNNQSATNTNDEKRFLDLIVTRYKAFTIYKKYDKKTSDYFLIKSFMLIIRTKNENLFNDRKNKKIAKIYFKKMILPYLKLEDIGIKEKTANIIGFLF